MSNNLHSELNQLQLQLATIQEQQRLQTFMIKQFQEQLYSYEHKHDDHPPLDLSSTSSTIEFQMESHEGEPQNPNMSKVCLELNKIIFF
jgi:hypothetical protein